MATQQINLDHPALHRQRVPWSLGQGLVAGVLLLLALGGASLALQRSAAQLQAQAQVMKDLASMRPLGLDAAASGPTGSDAGEQELAQLRQLDAAQRRVLSALDTGTAGSPEGYTAYFLALARQAQPTLWITGLAVGADGQALEIEGRMLDAQALPTYLKRLTAEPRFRGRSFAQLQLRSATEAGVPVTEFTLRSVPAAGTTVAAK
ncbi:hypothetical protein BurJ1DRAFT_1361 [Burkholderiales bacterium JOSHI_001]|nr:hypothetical protein BurJ1DRAFT_1361 [Burkholderiales bacterium JOSHI_001]